MRFSWHSPENITYLTGYETPGYYGYHCLVIVRGEQPVLVGRRIEILTNVPEFSWLTSTVIVEDHRTPVDVTAGVIEKLGMTRRKIGIEKAAWFVPINEYESLQTRLPRARLVDGSGLIEAARVVKSDAEVEMIRQGAAIADKAAIAGIRVTKPGVSEDRIAAAVYKKWCEEGAEYTGLPNFIASGRRSAFGVVSRHLAGTQGSTPTIIVSSSWPRRKTAMPARCFVRPPWGG